jgi:hypothetical protein
MLERPRRTYRRGEGEGEGDDGDGWVVGAAGSYAVVLRPAWEVKDEGLLVVLVLSGCCKLGGRLTACHHAPQDQQRHYPSLDEAEVTPKVDSTEI